MFRDEGGGRLIVLERQQGWPLQVVPASAAPQRVRAQRQPGVARHTWTGAHAKPRGIPRQLMLGTEPPLPESKEVGALPVHSPFYFIVSNDRWRYQILRENAAAEEWADIPRSARKNRMKHDEYLGRGDIQ